MFNSTSALLCLSLKKTFYNLRSISNKISLFINQNWFVIILPVLRLKLLLICPGHIYFVSLEFLHIFTPLRLQTSACNSCWHCELLGYMKADNSGMALSYLCLMHSQLFQNPLICSLKSLCLPMIQLCSSQPHQSFCQNIQPIVEVLHFSDYYDGQWQLWKLLSLWCTWQ